MLNPFSEVDWNPDPQKRRTFAVSLMVGFPILAILFLLGGYLRGSGWNLDVALIVGGAGAGAGVLFYVLPAIARPFYLLWYFVACCIGFVVGNVLMAVVFYIFVTGLGLLMRALGRRALRTNIERGVATYWLDAAPRPAPARYFRQF
jgi:hypothetical protein